MNETVPIPAKKQLKPHEASLTKALIVIDIPVEMKIRNETAIVNARKFAITTI
jgi:hypothetical protein